MSDHDCNQHPVALDHARVERIIRFLQQWPAGRDRGQGGVPTEYVAECIPQNQSTVAEKVTPLVRGGRLVRVNGFGGPKMCARPSYLTPDHPLAPTEEPDTRALPVSKRKDTARATESD